MTTTSAPTTCTIQFATGLCGAPAVTTFAGRDGTVYAECDDHAFVPSVPTADDLRVGDSMTVTAYGQTYSATVTHVGRTRCAVRFALRGGAEKILTVPIASVTR